MVATLQVGNVRVLVVPPRSRHTSGENAPSAADAETKQPSKQTEPSTSDTRAKQSSSEQKDPADNVRVVVVVPPRSRRSSGNEENIASGGTQTKQSSTASVELPSKTGTEPTCSLDQKQRCGEDNVCARTAKFPTVSVPPRTEEKPQQKSICVAAVRPQDVSKTSEGGGVGGGGADAAKAKKKIRFELIEDLPSPIHPAADDDRMMLTPAADFHLEPDAAPLVELCSVSDNASDLLAPSPQPTAEQLLPVELDSEAMMALRRLGGPKIKVPLLPVTTK